MPATVGFAMKDPYVGLITCSAGSEFKQPGSFVSRRMGEAMTDDEFEKLKQEMERVADYLQKSKEDLPPEAQEMVDDNFWELIEKEKP